MAILLLLYTVEWTVFKGLIAIFRSVAIIVISHKAKEKPLDGHYKLSSVSQI